MVDPKGFLPVGGIPLDTLIDVSLGQSDLDLPLMGGDVFNPFDLGDAVSEDYEEDGQDDDAFPEGGGLSPRPMMEIKS